MSTLATLAARSVHVSTRPPPRTLAESRQVLSALQKFGEVVTFRNLKYDTSNTSPTKSKTTVAVFDSPSAASAAITASPLLIPIPNRHQGQNQNNRHESNNSRPNYTLTSDNPSYSSDETNNYYNSRQSTHLTCTIAASHHNHQSALNRNPFYGTFELETGTAQYHDLVVNSRIPLQALADVPTARKKYTSLNRREKETRGTKMLGAASLMRLYREGLMIEQEREIGRAEVVGSDETKVG